MKRNLFNRSFTMIELLAVIFIISLLATLIIASVTRQRVKARDLQRKSDLKTLQNALEMYYNETGAYPNGQFFSVWDAKYWTQNHDTGNLYNALVKRNFISSLPVDPVNKETFPPNRLLDGPPNDLGYYYCSAGDIEGIGYVLGTNLEQGGTDNSKSGNYKIYHGARSSDNSCEQ